MYTVSVSVFSLWTVAQSAKRKLHQRWPQLHSDPMALGGLISFPPALKPSFVMINKTIILSFSNQNSRHELKI